MKKGETMTTENFVENSPPRLPAVGTRHQFSEVAHELKNCVSVLLLLVETIEMDREHPVPDEDSRKDLKRLIHKMNCLVENLISL
jgi:hypothetical protein